MLLLRKNSSSSRRLAHRSASDQPERLQSRTETWNLRIQVKISAHLQHVVVHIKPSAFFCHRSNKLVKFGKYSAKLTPDMFIHSHYYVYLSGATIFFKYFMYKLLLQ